MYLPLDTCKKTLGFTCTFIQKQHMYVFTKKLVVIRVKHPQLKIKKKKDFQKLTRALSFTATCMSSLFFFLRYL